MQENLFSKTEHLELPGGAPLTIYRSWLGEDDALIFHDSLFRSIKWEQPSIRIAGQSKKIPRLQAWFGHVGTGFTYSGTHFEPTPFTEEIIHLKRLVEMESQHDFNSVLVNLYRNEQDSVGWHADDEEEFGANPTIASLSLGESRRFQFKPKPHHLEAANWDNRQKAISIDLHSGDLLLMGKDVQVDWLHCIPKEAQPHQSRINLTFRLVVQHA